MEAHKTSVLVQQRACLALSNVAVDAGNSSKRVKSKASTGRWLEALVSAMETHNASDLVQKRACLALSNLGCASNLAAQKVA